MLRGKSVARKVLFNEVACLLYFGVKLHKKAGMGEKIYYQQPMIMKVMKVS